MFMPMFIPLNFAEAGAHTYEEQIKLKADNP